MLKRQMIGYILAAMVLFPAPQNTHAQTAMQQILSNGPADRRINIVFLSEGYTQNELGKYILDANALLNYLLRVSPYRAYPNVFNAFAISVASNESGADHPAQNIFRDTYFNSSYGTGNLQRLITISGDGYSKVTTLLQNSMPEYDLVVLIVNDTEYGGSGGFPAITSVHSSASEIVVHELGHSFADLTDEYESPFPGYTPYERLNSTQLTQREKIRWNAWISPSTPVPTPETGQFLAGVGLFEGGQYRSTGWYRPKTNCKMRSLGVPFCEVCAEAHVKAIYSLLGPIDASFPAQNSLTIEKTDSVLLRIQPLTPFNPTIAINWFVDEDTVAVASGEAFWAKGQALDAGSHTVTAKAADTTGLAKIASTLASLQDSVAWIIDVQETATAIAGENNGIPAEFGLDQNYPNPFNPETNISYHLAIPGHTRLEIFSVTGRRIRILVNRQQTAGRYAVKWDGRDEKGVAVSSGIFFLRFEAGAFSATRKLILNR
jgi:hypothetical protein